MAGQFAVIGLGRFGTSVARTLTGEGAEVLAVDRDLEAVDAIAPYVSQAVATDARTRGNLESHGLDQVDGIVVAIGEDFEAAVLITAMAKDMSIPVVVGRAYNDVQRRILKMVGATEVVNPEEEMGSRLARSLIHRDLVDFVDLPDGFVLREIKIGSEYDGKPLSKLLEDCVDRVVAVRLSRQVPGQDDDAEATTERFALPLEDTGLVEGDLLALIGPEKALERL